MFLFAIAAVASVGLAAVQAVTEKTNAKKPPARKSPAPIAPKTAFSPPRFHQRRQPQAVASLSLLDPKTNPCEKTEGLISTSERMCGVPINLLFVTAKDGNAGCTRPLREMHEKFPDQDFILNQLKLNGGFWDRRDPKDLQTKLEGRPAKPGGFSPHFLIFAIVLTEEQNLNNTSEKRKAHATAFNAFNNCTKIQKEHWHNSPGTKKLSNHIKCGGDLTPDKEEEMNHVSDHLIVEDVFQLIKNLHPKEDSVELSDDEILDDLGLLQMHFRPSDIDIVKGLHRNPKNGGHIEGFNLPGLFD